MNLDAKINNQITRNDFAIILACNRQLATLVPVRLVNNGTSDYKAGLVVGRITTSGLYKNYDDSASDGSQTAVGVLFEDVLASDVPASGLPVARAIVGGEVYLGKLTGFDAAAGTDLGARTIIDASGISILKF